MDHARSREAARHPGNEPSPKVGSTVRLRPEQDAIIPPGEYVVSKVNEDGSFHVGGNTAVWPRRIAA